MTGLVDALEGRGFVERRPAPQRPAGRAGDADRSLGTVSAVAMVRDRQAIAAQLVEGVRRRTRRPARQRPGHHRRAAAADRRGGRSTRSRHERRHRQPPDLAGRIGQPSRAGRAFGRDPRLTRRLYRFSSAPPACRPGPWASRYHRPVMPILIVFVVVVHGRDRRGRPDRAPVVARGRIPLLVLGILASRSCSDAVRTLVRQHAVSPDGIRSAPVRGRHAADLGRHRRRRPA